MRPSRRQFLATLPLLALAGGPGPAYPQDGVAKLRQSVNPEFQPWGPAQVVERVAEHLVTFAGEVEQKFLAAGVPAKQADERGRLEASYLRYFSMADVPRARMPEFAAALFFACNSASASPSVWHPHEVPNTDGRLYYVDLREAYWTAEAWEKVSLQDPYFREPTIPSASNGLKTAKVYTLANPVVRADWFLYYVGDTTQQLRIGQTQNDDALYYTLLYSTNVSYTEAEKTVDEEVGHWHDPVNGQDHSGDKFNDKTAGQAGLKWVVTSTRKVTRKVKTAASAGVPKTEEEFLRFWGVDEDTARKLLADNFAVVDEGRSGVSYQNRVVRRINAAGGVLWETYDVLRTAGNQDFLETLQRPPKDFDAGELIFRSAKGAQFYLLIDGKGRRVEFGDPRAVHDGVSGGRDVLVTWKSCVHCHDSGIIPLRNEVPLAIKGGADLLAKDPYEQQQIRSAYLQDLRRKIKFDQDEYLEFVKAVNGLSGEENVTQFRKARGFYWQPLTLAQMAREVGAADPEELASAISVGTKVRIGRLITDGQPILRSVWEDGGFNETAALLSEYRKANAYDRKQRGLSAEPGGGLMGPYEAR